jgi:hypothetical protein
MGHPRPSDFRREFGDAQGGRVRYDFEATLCAAVVIESHHAGADSALVQAAADFSQVIT